MSNLPPNTYSNVPEASLPVSNTGQVFNLNQPLSHVPVGQLPPSYGGLKDNSNSPLHGTTSSQNSVVRSMNNYNQSASSSPAFTQSGMLPQGYQSTFGLPGPSNSKPSSTNPSTSQYPPNHQQSRQINQNTPPLIPSSQQNQPLMNGPHSFLPASISNQYPVSSSTQNSVSMANRPSVSIDYTSGPMNTLFKPSVSKPLGPTSLTSQSNVAFSGPARNSPLLQGPPPVSGPPFTGMATQSPSNSSGAPLFTRPPAASVSGTLATAPLLGSRPMGINGPAVTPNMFPSVSGPPMTIGAPLTSSYPGLYNGPKQPVANPIGQNTFSGQSPPVPSPAQNMTPMAPQRPISGPASQGPQKTNLQNRYPQMPQSNYNHQQPMAQSAGMQYPQQYNTQGLTQQMDQLSVAKHGFDKLWGRQMVDLLQCKHILPEYPEEPPEIKLVHQFADSPNCSPEIFRCTLNRIPETNNLLQRSRLPLGILIHPFKDLNHLPVIQCSSIVRCRACRTYINPFVYFVDSKRWKCNLCYRVNELPEEFQYDPVSKSYGDPSRRPEIKSATIEFIAPGEYMLRPPQPAVYLFLFDVSQLARESGYLQVVCETLKNNLDQLPGDARTQIGFICYDSHVHYYLMSEGLTRPKEMTVLDIEEVFLPSPESLLVNLGERRELVRELLTVLPQRHSAPGTPASALGAALQAAHKLMSPTGGRVTVFQTCLPNVGPGALQSREDPNARSSKDVAHLNPATDFYKRIALDCSGAQIAVDLFLLNSQYSDLATLSGVSKFSAGTVYHLPLFKAARAHQADTLTRMFTRYLTRKIGFEAVMRVRCTRGVSIHTFHGNFFVRSTDLLSLPNVSPDAGFGMQLTIEESLSDLQQVCFQAALLYTSSKGERRIRVHTLALPIANSLTDVLQFADQQAIVGLVSKMAVDRCVSASLSEAREAVSNVCVDALSAYRLSQNLPAGAASASLHAPASLCLLPLYLLALLKRKAFRSGTSTRLDDRAADMCALKCLPLAQLLRLVYPDLYPLHNLRDYVRACDRHRNDDDDDNDGEPAPDPPRLHLSAERISMSGAYLLDDGECMIIYVCNAVSPAFLSDTFGVAAYTQLPDEAHSLPRINSEGNALLHAFIDKLNDDRPYSADILILRDNSPSRLLFTERLVDDRVESAFSYYEFLQHVKSQVK